jgi:PIN domain nuclease of toxin-antitoxin system
VNLLIDTHYLLWSAFDQKRIPAKARALLLDPGNALWFSVASIWEVAVKRALDRPSFQVEAAVLRAGLLANGYNELAIEGRHVTALAALPPLHGDPFDRMLISQALTEGMILLTADRQVGAYGGAVRLV